MKPANKISEPAGGSFYLRWLSLLSLCLFLGLSSPSLAQPPLLDPDLGLQRAGALVRAEEFTAALSLCQDLLEQVQAPVLRGQLFFIMGYCEFQLQRWQSSQDHLRESSRLFPELSFHGLFYAALAYENQDNYEFAVRYFDKLSSGNPPGDLKPRALMELVRCHRKLSDVEAAANAMGRLRGLAWHDPAWDRELTYTRGWIKVMHREYGEARETLVGLWREEPDGFWAGEAERLLQSEPSLSLPGTSTPFSDGDRLRRIQVLMDRGHPSQALTELAPIMAAAEQGAGPARLIGLLKLRGAAYAAARDFGKAIADFERAQSLLPEEDVDLTYQKARCLDRAGKLEEALAVYRNIWEGHPRSSFATRSLYYGAKILKQMNDWDSAEAAFKKLAIEYPGSSLCPEALWEIAWMRYLRGDLQTAGIALSRMTDKENDPDFNARALYWKSVVLHQLGNHAAATAAEDRVLAEFWKGPYAFYLVMVNRRPWPHPLKERDLPAAGDQPPLEFEIGRELYRLGLEDDAQGQLLALEKQGRLPEWMVLAVCRMYEELGDYYRAMVVANRLLKSHLAAPPPGEVMAWQLVYPQAYREVVTTYAANYGLDPMLVWCVMRQESLYQPRIRSHAGAMGLMQIMPATGQFIARGLGDKDFQKSWLNRPELNIKYGCYYLRGRMDQFNGGDSPEGKLWTTVRALAGYNAGPDRVEKWNARIATMNLPAAAFVEEIPFRETKDYVKRILGFYLIYRLVWSPGATPEPPVPTLPVVSVPPPSPPPAAVPSEPAAETGSTE